MFLSRCVPMTGRTITGAVNSGRNDLAMQQRNMANLKELKIRMGSVKNIQKITASMKLVAAARMKAAQTKMEKSRPFWIAAEAPFKAVAKDEKLTLSQKDKNLLILLTSDRGLCGAINNSLVRKAKEYLRQDPNLKIVVVGDKGKGGLFREYNANFEVSANEIGKKQLNFADVIPIAESIASIEFDKAIVLSNKFVSVLTFETLIRSIRNREYLMETSDFQDYDFEDAKSETIRDLYQFHLAALLYSSLTENAAAELAARMTSMDNASRNAKDVFQKLELSFNRQRQAAITTELTEIVAGTEALQ